MTKVKSSCDQRRSSMRPVMCFAPTSEHICAHNFVHLCADQMCNDVNTRCWSWIVLPLNKDMGDFGQAEELYWSRTRLLANGAGRVKELTVKPILLLHPPKFFAKMQVDWSRTSQRKGSRVGTLPPFVCQRTTMKTAILSSESGEGRSGAPCNGVLPTSNDQQPDVERCPSIAVSI